MTQEQKQALHIENGKSFSRGEANENERRWDDRKIDQLNRDPANNYDRTRMHLNFEIGSDGKIHPLGYMDKRLDERIQERLDELEYHPFKADSKIQPNICARLIIGGNHERTLEMAFGNQTVNLNKGADNSHLRRCREVEDWAMDSYKWCCEQFGKENVIGFQVHLDEKSPHCHALVIPVGRKGKEKKERVMWSAKFGKNGNEYKGILHAMHTSLYETVGKKYGLERGDSVEGRNVRHLDKHEFYREQQKLEKAIKGLTTMKENLENSIVWLQDEIQTVRCRLSDRKITLHEAESKVHKLENELSVLQEKLSDKTGKLQEKQQELNRLMKDVGNIHQIINPFKNHCIGFTAPQITEIPPTFGREKWMEKQNKRIETEFNKAVAEVERLYMAEAEKQVKTAGQNHLVDYKELHQYKNENGQLRQYILDITEENGKLNETLCGLLDVLAIPDFREKFFAIADALIGGRPIPASSGGGGEISNLRWDGRNPDEDEQSYRRRCMIAAAGMVISRNKTRGVRR